jgi:hypothetical protein
MNLVLRNELLTNPLGRAYAAMTNGEAAYDLRPDRLHLYMENK